MVYRSIIGVALCLFWLNANSSTLYGITGVGAVEGYNTVSGNLLIDFGSGSGGHGLTSGNGYVYANGIRNNVIGTIHKYDAVTGAYVESFGNESGTRDLAYADGVVYGISGTGEILSYDAITGEFLGGFGAGSGGGALSAGDGYIFTDLITSEGSIQKWNIQTKELELSFGVSLSGAGLAYDNGIIYSIKNSGNELLSYDVTNGNFLSSFGSNTGGTHIATDDGKVYVVAHRNGVNGSVHEYDATSNEYIKSFGDVSSPRQITLLSTVPVPATVWLFGSGLLGLIAVARRNE